MTLFQQLDIHPRYLRYLWPYRALLALALLIMLAGAGLSIAAPWPLKYVVDNVIGGQPFADWPGRAFAAWLGADRRAQAVGFGLLIVASAALSGTCGFAQAYLQGIIETRTTFRLRSDAFAHVQALSLRFHDRSRTGDVIGRVNSDADRIMETLVGSLGDLVVNLVKFLGVASVMLAINWRLSLIVLAYAPILLALFSRFRHHIKTAARAARAAEGQMLTVSNETVAAIRVVQAFGREPDEQRRFEAHGSARMHAELRSRRWESAFGPLIDTVKAAAVATIVWYGVGEIGARHLTVGELLIFVSYLATFYDPLQKFSRIAGALQKAAASAERLAELLDEVPNVRNAPNAVRLRRATGWIEFEQAAFGYDTDRAVLRDVTFKAHPGQTIAIVGPTGSGKTTIANLLLRFYDVSSGHILVDGLDLRRYRIHDLRRQFALVSQESMLFASSIGENIAYGRPDATQDEIIAAARAANAHDFICQLPHGYDTIVGERGATLSGGQRQRVAIARAMLRDAPILILDEPTAALDAESERAVMDAIARLMHGRTTFIIAHRLSTVRHADLILVVERGRLVERGRHTELMARGGRYAELVRMQQGEQAALELEVKR